MPCYNIEKCYLKNKDTNIKESFDAENFSLKIFSDDNEIKFMLKTKDELTKILSYNEFINIKNTLNEASQFLKEKEEENVLEFESEHFCTF